MKFGRVKEGKTGTRLVPVQPEAPACPGKPKKSQGTDADDVIGEIEAGLEEFTLSNVATNRTLDAAAISAADLADVVGTLIQDLKDRNLLP